MLDPAGWLEAAKAVPEGKSRRTFHDCGLGKVLTVDNKETCWSAWCHRCNDKGYVDKPRENLTQRLARLKAMREKEIALERDIRPPMPTNFDPSSWPLKARVWLYKAGLSNDTIRGLGFYHHAPTQRVVMPVFEAGKLVYWQARGFEPPPAAKYINPSAGKAVFRQGAGDVLVLTEDMLSAVRVGEVTEAWCIMGTAIPDGVMSEIMQAGKPVRVWLDPDAAGAKGRRKFVPLLRAYGVDAKSYTSARDPKFHSKEEIAAVIRADAQLSAV